MILKVGLLKEGVIERHSAVYDARELDLEFIDLHYVQKVVLNGSAERVKQTVSFCGTLSSRIEQTCSRCLEHIQSDLTAPFNLSYHVHGQEKINTTDDLRDILILGHPDRFLCSSDCRGVCSHCGANLNRDSCRCQNEAKN